MIGFKFEIFSFQINFHAYTSLVYGVHASTKKKNALMRKRLL